MNKQLRKVYDVRYKMPLLILVFGFLFFYLANGISHVNNWNSMKNYFESEEFITDFNTNPEYYNIGYDYEKGEELFPKDIEEYRTESLQVYAKNNARVFIDPNSPANEKDYLVGVDYWKNFDNQLIIITGFIVFIIGFGLFFIDLKTNYNQFLFSLSWLKKDLFRGKIVYFALPLLGSLALGTLANLLISYLFIPKIYINATFLQLLYSGFSHWSFLVLALTGGILLGTLLGNLILGPTVVGLVLLSLLFTQELYRYVIHLVEYYTNKYIWYDFSAFFVDNPGKTGTPWFVLLLFFVLAAFAIFLAEKIYQQISLENNGQMLTVPTLRRPVFITLATLSSLWFVLPFSGWSYYLIYREENYVFSMVRTIIVFTLCILISFLLVYIDEIPKRWNHFMHQRALKKSI